MNSIGKYRRDSAHMTISGRRCTRGCSHSRHANRSQPHAGYLSRRLSLDHGTCNGYRLCSSLRQHKREPARLPNGEVCSADKRMAVWHSGSHRVRRPGAPPDSHLPVTRAASTALGSSTVSKHTASLHSHDHIRCCQPRSVDVDFAARPVCGLQ